jgi:hypothetical protein
MTLANLSGGYRYNVRLDRYLDADADNTTSNVYGRTADAAYAYVDGGYGVVLSDLTRTIAHSTVVHTYGTWIRNTCNQVSVATPTPYSDNVARISYFFGTMTNGTKTTIKVNIRRF